VSRANLVIKYTLRRIRHTNSKKCHPKTAAACNERTDATWVTTADPATSGHGVVRRFVGVPLVWLATERSTGLVGVGSRFFVS